MRRVLFMAKNPVKITETVLRDGHQSLVATRMRIGDMLPQLEALDKIGYNALEAWGGATFDTCLRFLDEDPWERLDTLKANLKTPIQMLLRGQNLLGYTTTPTMWWKSSSRLLPATASVFSVSSTLSTTFAT